MDEHKRTVIGDEDVYWEMDWKEINPDKPTTELIFDQNLALARLLAEEVVFITNSILVVNCNDIFAWASADCEELQYDEIQALYDLWLKDTTWGPAKWCIMKRHIAPQQPVIGAMKSCGAWDEDLEKIIHG